MLDSASELELESDASSIDGSKDAAATNEQLSRRIDSLQQENRVLKTEVETLKLKIKGLNETIQQLRRNSVNIQAKAEQEEEFISNTLLKKITELKKEKESLALNYEQEEQCLTNELNRKFTQLRQEKVALERTLAREQEDQVSKLKSRIEKLETDMSNKQECLDRLRREKIELENALEQEQEALVNRLWKKMEKLETEKKTLQEKLESLGALLSASSSNQSLASVNHTNAPGINAIGSSISVTSAGCPPSSRPTSDGSANARGSFRLHSANMNFQTTCSISPPHSSSSAAVGGLVPSNRPPISPILLAGSGLTSSGENRLQLNQSASVPNESTAAKIGINDSVGANLIPPQSPMDIDNLDHLASGTASPVRPDSTGGPPHIRLAYSSKPGTSTHLDCRAPESEECTGCLNLESCPVWESHTYVNRLREEVYHLRQLLDKYETESAAKMPLYESEERSAVEENRRLRKLLHIEKERREVLFRQLSESESSLEMEDERQFNEACRNPRFRTTSDSSSFHPPNPSMIFGPGHAYAAAVAAGCGAQCSSTTNRVCRECGQRLPPPSSQVLEDWPCSRVCSSSSSSVRGLPTSLHTSTAIARSSHGRCCSPGKPCGAHHVSLPNSPATPTTSPGCLGQAFVKPNSTRAHMTMHAMDKSGLISANDHDNVFPHKTLPSSSTEQLLASSDLDENAVEPDEDEDARCATPPVCQPDSTKSN